MLERVPATPARLKLFGESPAGIYLQLDRLIWEPSLPDRRIYLVRTWGSWPRSLIRGVATRYASVFHDPEIPRLKRKPLDMSRSAPLKALFANSICGSVR
jgi:hypothetical protein